MWIYRANLNALRLGGEGLRYSPGWAIGWFFIPVLNLWKPYQAFKEIWLASANPKHWKSLTRPALLPVWWTLFLVSASVGQAALRAAIRAEELPELIIANTASLAAHLVDIPLDIVFIILIRQIYRMQMEQSTMRAAPDARNAIPASA